MNGTIRREDATLIGGALVGLGLVWALDLWWLVLPGMLLGLAVWSYRHSHKLGRVEEALQAALWFGGFGLLALTGFVWPGVLILAGMALLLRGREHEVDARLQQIIGDLRGLLRRPAPGTPSASHSVPIDVDDDQDTTTTRL